MKTNLFNMKKLLMSTGAIALFAIILVSCSKEEIQVNDATSAIELDEKTLDIEGQCLGPDLVITSFTSDLPIGSNCGGAVQQAVCGQQNSIFIKVTNIGNVTAGPYTMALAKVTGITGGPYTQNSAGSLAPGQTELFTFGPAPFGGCSGSWSIQQMAAFADFYNDVAECREDNNRGDYKYCGD